MRPRALLLSAYDADSHARWRQGLIQHTASSYDWSVLTLAPRHFAWRARSNPLSLIHQHRTTLEQPWALVVATSMTELATLRGLVPSLARAHTVVYFHENQLAYPSARPDPNLLHLQLGNLYTALCGDVLLFNSEHNKRTLFKGLDTLLRKMPEGAPLTELLHHAQDKARVLPVPLEAHLSPATTPRPKGPPRLLWNHRWEHDKAPQRLFDALNTLSQRGHSFELRVLGQRFRRWPECFDHAQETLKAHITHWGYIEDAAQYRALLRSSDLAISTALHEFQGLAIQEAILSGARPIAPDRLAYPEYIHPDDLYPSWPQDPQREHDALVAHLERCFTQPWDSPYPAKTPQWRWEHLRDAYLDAFTPKP